MGEGEGLCGLYLDIVLAVGAFAGGGDLADGAGGDVVEAEGV